jgi:hypothetical protein
MQILLHREAVEIKIKNSRSDQQERNIHSSVAITEKEEEPACLKVRIM